MTLCGESGGKRPVYGINALCSCPERIEKRGYSQRMISMMSEISRLSQVKYRQM